MPATARLIITTYRMICMDHVFPPIHLKFSHQSLWVSNLSTTVPVSRCCAGIRTNRVYVSEAPHHSIMQKIRLDPGFVQLLPSYFIYEDDNHLNILGGKNWKIKALFTIPPNKDNAPSPFYSSFFVSLLQLLSLTCYPAVRPFKIGAKGWLASDVPEPREQEGHSHRTDGSAREQEQVPYPECRRGQSSQASGRNGRWSWRVSRGIEGHQGPVNRRKCHRREAEGTHWEL